MSAIKRWARTVILAMGVLVLAACGSQTPSPATQPATSGAGYPPPAATSVPDTPVVGYPGPANTLAPATLVGGYPGPAGTSSTTDTATAQPATPGPGTQAPVEIVYRNFEIVPARITLKVGTPVRFVIKDGLHQPYNSTPPNTFEAPANLGDGTTFAYTFAEAGTTTLLCGYHKNMQAVVDVEP